MSSVPYVPFPNWLEPAKGLLKGAVEYAGPTACFELFQHRGPHQSRWKGLCASPSQATIFYSGNSTEIHANYRVRSPSWQLPREQKWWKRSRYCFRNAVKTEQTSRILSSSRPKRPKPLILQGSAAPIAKHPSLYDFGCPGPCTQFAQMRSVAKENSPKSLQNQKNPEPTRKPKA